MTELKYEQGDEVLYGNPGHKKQCVVIEVAPPQPTYKLQDKETGAVFWNVEERYLALAQKKCVHERYRLVYALDEYAGLIHKSVSNDHCPLCGEKL